MSFDPEQDNFRLFNPELYQSLLAFETARNEFNDRLIGELSGDVDCLDPESGIDARELALKSAESYGALVIQVLAVNDKPTAIEQLAEAWRIDCEERMTMLGTLTVLHELPVLDAEETLEMIDELMDETDDPENLRLLLSDAYADNLLGEIDECECLLADPLAAEFRELGINTRMFPDAYTMLEAVQSLAAIACARFEPLTQPNLDATMQPTEETAIWN